MDLNFTVDCFQNVDHNSTMTGGNRELFNRSFYSQLLSDVKQQQQQQMISFLHYTTTRISDGCGKLLKSTDVSSKK